MNTHSDKTAENKSQAVANTISKQQNTGEAGLQIEDNRPQIIAQRKLQEMANNSLQVKQLRSYQAMANNYSSKAIQRKENLEEEPVQKKANNTGLPDNLKTGVENLSGFSMDDVKVHYNSDKPAQLQAHAYAQGSDIHIAPGQEKHLPHEAWHVVQQKQGRVTPTLQMKGGVNVNDDAGLESEADAMGTKAIQMKWETENVVENHQLQRFNNIHVSQLTTIKNNLIQLISGTQPIQKVRYSELAPQIKGADLTRFIGYLRNKVPEFSGQSVPTVRTALVTDDTDYEQLNQWITDWRQIHEAAHAEAAAVQVPAAAAMMQDRPLPQSISHNGTHVSFNTNIQSGINGLFDLWYYHNLHVLDVDVKFALPPHPSALIIETLRAVERFWNNKFHFTNTHSGETIRIDVNIIPTQIDPHFSYVDIDGAAGANPNVLRAGQQFSTRTIGNDRAAAQQPSALHEFGHVLGLGEEYGMTPDEHEGRAPTHHLAMASDENRGHVAIDENHDVPGSIMGRGIEIQPQHYSAILAEFCKLNNYDKAEWRIDPGR